MRKKQGFLDAAKRFETDSFCKELISSNRSISNLGKILIQFRLYKTNLYYISTHDGLSVVVVNL